MPRDEGEKVVSTNRKARHDYHIEDTYECGLALTGTEVKALRLGKASLVDGWAQIVDGEMWMESVHIPEYTQGTWTNHATRRKRKLLLHRSEIIKISHRVKDGGYTLVPLKIYFKDGRAKVELAIAKGKKDYDKRHTLREKEDKREAERAMKSKRVRGE
jgi:SsrA-binding protein